MIRFSLPIRLLITILFVIFFGAFLPEMIVRLLYTMSLILKDILTLMLPFIIFSFVFSGIVRLHKKAPLILILLVLFIFCSNAFGALIAYCASSYILPFISHGACIKELVFERVVGPLFGLSSVAYFFPTVGFFFDVILPMLPLGALLFGIILGFIMRAFPCYHIERPVDWIRVQVGRFFTYIFIPLLPLYIAGFFIKMRYEGAFMCMLKHYGGAILFIVSMQVLYLALIYFVAAGANVKRAWRYIRNASASYFTAFATMSSTMTVPVTISCARKNGVDEAVADMALPVMANAHLLGDAFGTPILALISTLLFYGQISGFGNYALFVFYFCVSLFAAAGVPGGGIIIMIPILKTYFGITGDILGVIVTLYILLDPCGTATNVMGDGALVLMLDKTLRCLGLIDSEK